MEDSIYSCSTGPGRESDGGLHLNAALDQAGRLMEDSIYSCSTGPGRETDGGLHLFMQHWTRQGD